MSKRKYRPSNGTEGEMFMERFCYQCVHEEYGESELCDILTRTMIYDVEDDKYPDEWVYGDDGPVCTAFVKEGKNEKV